jgi:anti-anti-sigma regulatory factor
MFCQSFAICPQTPRLAHPEAFQLSGRALQASTPALVVLDLSSVADITTAAFARLILLRRELRRRGSDLRLSGLQGRGAKLYAISRLQSVLPSY